MLRPSLTNLNNNFATKIQEETKSKLTKCSDNYENQKW